MPKTKIIFYKEVDGTCPFVEWFNNLPKNAKDRCRVRIQRLAELGHELRRPEADLLRDKIHELRPSVAGIQYRVLYFFHGQTAAIVSHGIVKEREVPTIEIERAIQRKKNFEQNPIKHTQSED